MKIIETRPIDIGFVLWGHCLVSHTVEKWFYNCDKVYQKLGHAYTNTFHISVLLVIQLAYVCTFQGLAFTIFFLTKSTLPPVAPLDVL